MKRLLATLMVALALVTTPVISAAQSNDELARANFEAVIDDLNNNSFKSFQEAIDKQALLGRVIGAYMIEPEVRDQLSSLFEEWVQELFVAAFPPSQSEILGTVVAFEGYGDSARALVRFESSG